MQDGQRPGIEVNVGAVACAVFIGAAIDADDLPRRVTSIAAITNPATATPIATK